MSLRSNYLIVAAIDFGTAYSGYAFSKVDDFKKDPLKVFFNYLSIYFMYLPACLACLSAGEIRDRTTCPFLFKQLSKLNYVTGS